MKAPLELWTVAQALGDLRGDVVFVGGMIRELLVTDPAAVQARATRDVDFVVEVDSRAEYYTLGERLRALGFSECTDEGAPLCRWVVRGVRVDVMPLDPGVLGFSNVWYPSGISHALVVQGVGGSIRIVDAVHFCATKAESFLSRGEGDFSHHDLEDFIAIVDGRAELASELGAAPTEVRSFVAEVVAMFLANSTFRNYLPGLLSQDEGTQARVKIVLDRLDAIARLASSPEINPEPIPHEPVRRDNDGWIAVRSSNMRRVRYVATSETLAVEFHGGRNYEYRGVPAAVFDGLLRAASKGRYFHIWIRDRYVSERVR